MLETLLSVAMLTKQTTKNVLMKTNQETSSIIEVLSVKSRGGITIKKYLELLEEGATFQVLKRYITRVPKEKAESIAEELRQKGFIAETLELPTNDSGEEISEIIRL